MAFKDLFGPKRSLVEQQIDQYNKEARQAEETRRQEWLERNDTNRSDTTQQASQQEDPPIQDQHTKPVHRDREDQQETHTPKSELQEAPQKGTWFNPKNPQSVTVRNWRGQKYVPIPAEIAAENGIQGKTGTFQGEAVILVRNPPGKVRQILHQANTHRVKKYRGKDQNGNPIWR